MSPTKLVSIASATLLCLCACDSGSTSTAPSTNTPSTSAGTRDTTFVGRWRIYAIPADTVVFGNDGKGVLIADLGFRVATDSFQWSAAGGAIHFTHADGKTEDGTYRFFGKDSFNMTWPGLGTQLYLRLK